MKILILFAVFGTILSNPLIDNGELEIGESVVRTLINEQTSPKGMTIVDRNITECYNEDNNRSFVGGCEQGIGSKFTTIRTEDVSNIESI